MANNLNPSDPASDEFLEQILGFPTYAAAGEPNLARNEAAMMLQLGSSQLGVIGAAGLGADYAAAAAAGGFPLGLSLDPGKGGGASGSRNSSRLFQLRDDSHDSSSSSSVKLVHDSGPVTQLYSQGFHAPAPAPAPPLTNTLPNPPQIRPRVRARRGQATDPHSIAERLRRERIAEKIRALQELVPNVNKTDRAAMLDEIVDYVKFLRLQVKVLSMSRLGGAGAVAPLVVNIPISDEGGSDGGRTQPAWEKWSNDGTEEQVAKLMEENVGAAMQFLQSKELCIMPISLASAIYHTQTPETPSSITQSMDPHSSQSLHNPKST